MAGVKQFYPNLGLASMWHPVAAGSHSVVPPVQGNFDRGLFPSLIESPLTSDLLLVEPVTQVDAMLQPRLHRA